MIRCSTVSFGRLVCFDSFDLWKLVQGFVTIIRSSPPVLYRVAFDVSTGHTALDAMNIGNYFVASIARGSPRAFVCAIALIHRFMMPHMCRSTLISYSPTVSKGRVNISSYSMPDGWSAILMRRRF